MNMKKEDSRSQDKFTKLKVLVVDDEVELRKNLTTILNTLSNELVFEISEASNGREAVDSVKRNEFDLVLMDVRMPDLNGLDALRLIKEHDSRIFVVIMTAHSNLNDAVIAIKEGAYDYCEKPVSPNRLLEIVKKSMEARELVSNLALSNPIFDDDVDSEFVGRSNKMREVYDLINKLCRVDTSVLVRGENGTGKELVARAIHFNSPRKAGPFVAINCGAIPESLMESELFGHEKGAFTGAIERKIGKFQLANGGTLFLDEVGELKPEMQVKLLRVLQEKKFVPVGGNREIKTNARIVAATNRNLEKMIEEGVFREDFFYRLNVVPIFLPPLRERKEDIGELVNQFIKKFSKDHPHSQISGISKEALDLLVKFRWPGNIRELENIIERCFIVETSSQITIGSLPKNILDASQTSTGASPGNSAAGNPQGTQPPPMQKIEKDSMPSNDFKFQDPSHLDFEVFKEQAEKDFIISALKANRGKINQTVAHANIPKNTLLRKIKKYGIIVKDYSE